jgi:filamentous hemagglutinin family protein
MDLKLHFSLPWFFAIYLVTSSFQYNFASAQVTSDGTTGTIVDANGNSFEINAGTRSGGNLFHSFGEFSVPNGGQAVFNNATDVSNILSRVTGGNASQINGLIQANGSANLFLINPAGIIFGPGASLAIGGSFYGSTADSILFEDGEFSAVNNLNQPILTINAPIGLNLRNNPADITFNGNENATEIADFPLLSVLEDQSINLIGGNLDFNNIIISAFGGNVALGGLQASGTVNINENDNLSFPENVARGNISLDNSKVFVNLASNGEGGTINLNGNNIELLNGSQLLGGIAADSGFAEAQAGNINLNATGAIDITEASSISNIVGSGATGNAGNIDINAASLTLSDAASLFNGTFGQGNGGLININTTESVTLNNSYITNLVGPDAKGNSGDLNFTTTNFSVINGSLISATNLGKGNAGDININATESFIAADKSLITSNIGSPTGVQAVGEVGNISINAKNISLSGTAQIQAGAFSGATAEATGTVSLTASESISFTGTDTGIFSNNDPGSFGNASNTQLIAPTITLSDGAIIKASNAANGQGGNVTVESDQLTLNGSNILADAEGDEGGGANITLDIAENIILQDNSVISAKAFNDANGGNVNIDTNFVVAFPNQIDGNGNDIIASAEKGNGGRITINGESLLGIEERKALNNNQTNDIDASSDFGLNGTVSIFTPDINPVQGATELPNNVVEPEQTTAQACQANREAAANNGLVINGKGGIPNDPTNPLVSELININGDLTQAESPQPASIQPILTSKGKIIPALGVEVKENGDFILTAYPTNNNSRIPQRATSCGKSWPNI